MNPEDHVALIYGDGKVRYYVVVAIDRYQALQPHNPFSEFIDLSNNSRLTSTDLFYREYNGDGELVLQTCIEMDGSPSWGRYFVKSKPANTTLLLPERTPTMIRKATPFQ
jgi:hypothetical protein